MAGETVKIAINGAEVAARFRALSKKMGDKAAYSALGAAGRMQRDEAKRRAPVLRKPDPRRLPGTLRDAIRTARGRRGPNGEYVLTVGVRTLQAGLVRKFKAAARGRLKSAEAFGKFKRAKAALSTKNPRDPYYWRWVEFKTGRKNLQAQPFLGPAFEARARDLIDVIVRRAGEQVDKHAQEVSGGNRS